MPHLKELREARKWSQHETAQALGISEPYYWRIETGRAKPGQALSERLAEVFPELPKTPAAHVAGPNSMPDRHSIAYIVNQVLGEMSPEQAAEQIGYTVGREGIRALRNGKVGWERTVRTFARGFASALLAHFGNEIETATGGKSYQNAEDWFASQAGFGSASSASRFLLLATSGVPSEDLVAQLTDLAREGWRIAATLPDGRLILQREG